MMAEMMLVGVHRTPAHIGVVSSRAQPTGTQAYRAPNVGELALELVDLIIPSDSYARLRFWLTERKVIVLERAKSVVVPVKCREGRSPGSGSSATDVVQIGESGGCSFEFVEVGHSGSARVS